MSEEKFWRCRFRDCLTLDDGELNYCARASHSYLIQHFTRQPEDYVKIEDTIEFRERFYDYILNKHPMEACRYCNGTSRMIMVPPAIQL